VTWRVPTLFWVASRSRVPGRMMIGTAAFVAIACLLPPSQAKASVGSPPSLGSLAHCLRAQGLTTLRSGEFLDLPRPLPPARVLDRALPACRRYTLWPAGYGAARTVRAFEGRARRFRNCMKRHGRDPGPPIIFLGLRSIGATFGTNTDHVPTICDRILSRG
jgi:hypothetical protein